MAARRWAARARARVTAARQPLVLEDAVEEFPAKEDERPLLFHWGQEKTLRRRSRSVLVVSITLHWPVCLNWTYVTLVP